MCIENELGDTGENILVYVSKQSKFTLLQKRNFTSFGKLTAVTWKSQTLQTPLVSYIYIKLVPLPGFQDDGTIMTILGQVVAAGTANFEGRQEKLRFNALLDFFTYILW